jgi:hypothetical protein
MDQRLREIVRARSLGICEYCRFPEKFSVRPFHCDHVVARQHGGESTHENLAWACNHCNLHKGPNLTGIDPLTGQTTPLFNPRRDRWEEHFAWEKTRLVGRTPVGRTTVYVLDANNELLVATRAALIAERVYFADTPSKPD